LPGEFRPGWWHKPAEAAIAAEHPLASKPEPRPAPARARRGARRAALTVALATTAVAGLGLGYAWDNRPASAPPVAAAAEPEPSAVLVAPAARTFVRDGKAFYSATTRRPRLELPARVRFAPGRYSWRVVPVVAGNARVPVVDSTFTVK
jgi:hypothetical protein